MLRQAHYRLATTGLVVLLASMAVTLTPSGRWAMASAQPLAAAISCSEVTATPGNYVVELTSRGQPRQIRLHIPPGYLAGHPAPLVINLHGLGGSGIQQDLLSGMSAKADEAGFIAAHPEGRGVPQSWYVGPAVGGQQEDVLFIQDLIDCLKNQLTIDADRLYATGFSNGGGMANRLGCDLADLIAAIGPVPGAYLFHDTCLPLRPLPVVAFHGTADEIVPYAGGGALPLIPHWAADWAARDGCGLTSTVTYSQGDVTGETWENCADDAVVTLYTIAGGKHRWPGSPLATPFIDATDAIWAFFTAHSFQSYRLYLPLVLRH